jgi:predicted dehydrogenase
MEAMLRDWVNWTWLSGDHIVEQHIHNIDVANWFTGKIPQTALGIGSRQRRLTGDQYDNFSIDFVYEGQIHMHSMCRQINDCTTGVYEYLRGTDGYTNCKDTIWNPDETVMYEYEYPVLDEESGRTGLPVVAMDQEHVNLVTAIRTGEQLVTAEATAQSTLVAIMGRTSAYTGKMVTWDEMMNSDMKLGPPEIKMGPVDLEAIVPVPGSAPEA